MDERSENVYEKGDWMESIRKRYKYAMFRKWCNQKEIPTPKTKVGKTKLTIKYLYLENIP